MIFLKLRPRIGPGFPFAAEFHQFLQTMQLSSILSRFSEPETLKMAKLGRELRAKGVDVIDLSLENQISTPPNILKTLQKKRSMTTGVTILPWPAMPTFARPCV